MIKRIHIAVVSILIGGVAMAQPSDETVSEATDIMDVYRVSWEGDPVLQQARARLESAREIQKQAFSGWLPQISGTASYSETDGEQTQSGQKNDIDSSSDSLDLSLDQSIYNRSTHMGYERSKFQVAQAEADYEAAVANFVLRVAQRYFDVLSAIDTLEFAQAEEKALKRQLEQAEQRFEVGLTPITDAHEARASYDNARARTIVAANSLDDAREALREVSGQYYNDLKRLQEELPLVAPEPDNQEQWVRTAMQNSPTIQSFIASAEAAEKGISVANAGHWPSLGAFARYNDSSQEGNSGIFAIDGSDTRTVIGLRLSVPIYSGGLTSSQARQARSDHEVALEGLDAERRRISRQIRNDYRGVIAGISQVEAFKQALISAESAVEATEAGFEVGTRTIVEVLLSQQRQFQAQRDYSRARHDYVLSHLRLRTTAGLIEEADIARLNQVLE